MAEDDDDDDEKLFLRPLDAVARGQKAKITISFVMKNSKNNNIIFGFSFQFYVFGFSLSNKQNISQGLCLS